MASVVELDISSLLPLLEKKDVQKRLWHRIACRVIMLHPDIFPKLVDFDYRALKKLVNQVNITLVEPENQISCPGGAILFSGELGKLEKVEVAKASPEELGTNKMKKFKTLHLVDLALNKHNLTEKEIGGTINSIALIYPESGEATSNDYTVISTHFAVLLNFPQ